MFCSKCGHTLAPGAESCAYCGAEILESALLGAAYTSAQPRIMPGDDVAALLRGTKRVNRAARPRQIQPDDLFETARDDAPEVPSMRQPARSDEDLTPDDEFSREAAESLGALDDELSMEDLDMTRFRPRDIKTAGQSGISEDANQVIQAIETTSMKRAQRRQRRQGNAEPAEDFVESFADESLDEGQPAEPVDIDAEAELVEDDQVSEFEEISDYDEDGRAGFSLSRVLKVVLAVAVVALLAVGGVLWFRYMRTNTASSPIENVGQELYDNGIALIKQHSTTAYENEILDSFKASGSDFGVLTSALSASQAEVAALTPEEPTDNELLFMNALNAIQRNIGNCITADAMELDSTVSTGTTPEVRWAVVNNSISILESANSAASLTAIINGEVVAVMTEAPEPTATPAPNYNTLSKGDKNDEVKRLQQRLIDLGYLNDTADGSFGNKTMTAVKIFQQVAGLPVTGVADDATLTALYDENAPTAEQVGAAVQPDAEAGAEEQTPAEAGDDLPDDGENVLDEDFAI